MIGWAWRSSRQVDTNWKLRLRFVQAALANPSLVRDLRALDATTPFGRLLAEHPETMGNFIWPYQCAAWDADARFRRILDHLDVVERLPALHLARDEKIVFADLRSISGDVWVMIDHSPWLAREGHLTLSLFKGHFRAFTVAFSLRDASPTEMFIGGIQGRRTGGDMLELYRDLTRDFHGTRPRDFMLEMVRMFANHLGIERVQAVADDFKISRHPYFSKKETGGFNYDEVWLERGGVRAGAECFDLPLSGTRRDLDQVPAKKRGMYRRRYEMFDQIEQALPADLAQAERRTFEAS